MLRSSGGRGSALAASGVLAEVGVGSGSGVGRKSAQANSSGVAVFGGTTTASRRLLVAFGMHQSTAWGRPGRQP